MATTWRRGVLGADPRPCRVAKRAHDLYHLSGLGANRLQLLDEHSVNPFREDPRQFIWRVNQIDRLGRRLAHESPLSPSSPPVSGGGRGGERGEEQRAGHALLACQSDSPAAQGSGGYGSTECSRCWYPIKQLDAHSRRGGGLDGAERSTAMLAQLAAQ